MCYVNLKAGLEDIGFKKSNIYPFLFISDKVICVDYVDDCILFHRYQKEIYAVLESFHKGGD